MDYTDTYSEFGEGVKRFVNNIQQNRKSKLASKNKSRLLNAQSKFITAKGLAAPSAPVVIQKSTSNAASAAKKPEKKSNTWLYVGIGVGVLALGTVAYLIIKKSKK